MRRQSDDNEAIRARVAALPAEWYAERPIPPRLARAIANASLESQWVDMTRADERVRWRNPQTGKLEPLSHSDVMQALAAQKRKPTEHDAPPIKPFPGRKPTIHEGQLTLSPERES